MSLPAKSFLLDIMSVDSLGVGAGLPHLFGLHLGSEPGFTESGAVKRVHIVTMGKLSTMFKKRFKSRP